MIKPLEWNNNVGLRMELYGCNPGNGVTGFCFVVVLVAVVSYLFWVIKHSYPHQLSNEEVIFIYSQFSHDVKKNSNYGIIDSSEFLISWGITAAKHIYLQKCSVWKGSWFSDRGRLNFLAFAWHCIQLTAEKALMCAKNVTNFLRFCYLNIPCLRMNITFIFTNSSSDVFTIL